MERRSPDRLLWGGTGHEALGVGSEGRIGAWSADLQIGSVGVFYAALGTRRWARDERRFHFAAGMTCVVVPATFGVADGGPTGRPTHSPGRRPKAVGLGYGQPPDRALKVRRNGRHAHEACGRQPLTHHTRRWARRHDASGAYRRLPVARSSVEVAPRRRRGRGA
jgi:hypothetical protein